MNGAKKKQLDQLYDFFVVAHCIRPNAILRTHWNVGNHWAKAAPVVDKTYFKSENWIFRSLPPSPLPVYERSNFKKAHLPQNKEEANVNQDPLF